MQQADAATWRTGTMRNPPDSWYFEFIRLKFNTGNVEGFNPQTTEFSEEERQKQGPWQMWMSREKLAIWCCKLWRDAEITLVNNGQGKKSKIRIKLDSIPIGKLKRW